MPEALETAISALPLNTESSKEHVLGVENHPNAITVTAFYSGHWGLPETQSNTLTFTVRTGGSISGTVTNATTGQPISGATVDAMQNGNVVDTATADASGNYTFPELPPGTYTLVARATRFPSSTRENVHFIAGQNTVVNFRLSRLVCQIETVDGVGDAGRHASLALDSSGRPHISYYDMTPDDLKYAYYDGFTWQIEAGGRCYLPECRDGVTVAFRKIFKDRLC